LDGVNLSADSAGEEHCYEHVICPGTLAAHSPLSCSLPCQPAYRFLRSSEAAKAAAVAKRAATRAARGTEGPKAKLAINGTVPTPPATPAKQ